MKARKQSSTSYPILFLMVDSTDHVTGKTGLSPTVTISKNGGAFAAPSGAITELSSGWYAIAGNATDRNTIGELLIHATGAGSDPMDDRYLIVPFDPFDAAGLGLSYLDVAVSTRLAAADYTAPPSAASNASATRTELAVEMAQITLAKQIAKNRTETNPLTGIMTVYADDGVSVLLTANIYADVAGATAYDGTAGVNRRNALT